MGRSRGQKKGHGRQGDIGEINQLKNCMSEQRRKSEGDGYVV